MESRGRVFRNQTKKSNDLMDWRLREAKEGRSRFLTDGQSKHSCVWTCGVVVKTHSWWVIQPLKNFVLHLP